MIVHLLGTICVIVAGVWTGLRPIEWAILALAATLVISLEAMNAAIEFVVDVASPDFHPIAGKAKDVASAAVLIAAIGAVVVGAFIFLPYWI